MDPLQSRDSTFVERRKYPDSVHELINSELNELNRRRDDNLRNKLEAIEKYFNLSITTRADALHIAITRIQNDNSTCATRCGRQVAEFNRVISNIRDKVTREEERTKLFREVSGDQSKISDKEFIIIKDKVSRLERWVDLNWRQTIIYLGAALVLLYQLSSWLHEKLQHVVP